MNIRSFLGIEGGKYAEFNREERHLTAILFHAINLDGNLRRFLEAIECPHGLDPEYEPAIYYEFAFLRDAWNKIDGNEVKRGLIEECLPEKAFPSRVIDTPLAFNTHFGVSGNASKDHIQNPGRWSVGNFDQNIELNDEFRATCLFKWSFNAKPDLVIQTSQNRCVCIEAKLESRENSYPISNKERAVFKQRALNPVRQTEVQVHMMADLLGFEAQHVLLSKTGREESTLFRAISWRSVFEAMTIEKLPAYMKLTLEKTFSMAT